MPGQRSQRQGRNKALPPSQAATPKQVAYLTFLGRRKAHKLTMSGARAEIERLHARAQRPCFRRLHERVSMWRFRRWELHPDLYPEEAASHIVQIWRDELRGYVRRRIVGASERLTEEKMRAVVRQLTLSDPWWWQHDDFFEQFFDTLCEQFPGCVDGTPPDRRKHSEQTMQPRTFFRAVGWILFVVLSIAALLLVGVIFFGDAFFE